MAGLLDKKSRILDMIITDIGREEATKNELTFEYVAFSDQYSLYEYNPDFDNTSLLSFEATSLPTDLLITDIENDGKVISTRMSKGTPERVKQFLDVDNRVLTQSDLEKYVNNLSSSFVRQALIGTKQNFVENDEFILTPVSMSFAISDNQPFKSFESTEKSLNELPNMFQDDDFKTQQNFKFLPPMNSSDFSVFEYDDITQMNYPRTIDAVINQIKNNELKVIQFIETSEKNNLIIQFFEIIDEAGNNKELNKLKIVRHFSENINDDEAYFIGKTIKDFHGVETFIKLFTLVIHK